LESNGVLFAAFSAVLIAFTPSFNKLESSIVLLLGFDLLLVAVFLLLKNQTTKSHAKKGTVPTSKTNNLIRALLNAKIKITKLNNQNFH